MNANDKPMAWVGASLRGQDDTVRVSIDVDFLRVDAQQVRTDFLEQIKTAVSQAAEAFAESYGAEVEQQSAAVDAFARAAAEHLAPEDRDRVLARLGLDAQVPA